MMRISHFSPVRLFVYFFICLFFHFFLIRGAQAASVKFDQSVVSVPVGSTFTIGVVVDAASDQITSTDMWIPYDSSFLEAQSASSGAFFPAVTNNIAAGKIYIAGLVVDPGTYKTGSGTVATITFKGLKNGRVTLAYDCRTDASNSTKVIKNAVDPINIVNCGSNGNAIITIGTGESTISPTASSVAPTSVYQTQSPNPTALPQSGIMDAMPKVFVAGTLFMIIGVVMRVLLLL